MTLSTPSRRFLIFLIIGEVALEPFDMAVAFEGQHVGGDAVEEEAVVADDDGVSRRNRAAARLEV